jgi:hypothetical protein
MGYIDCYEAEINTGGAFGSFTADDALCGFRV